MIRLFTIEDYEDAYQLWQRTPGMGLRYLDDSLEGIQRFIHRNPATNFVCVEDGHIVGVMLSGHDGRRGFIYHACVDILYRQKSIGRQLAEYVTEAMKAEGITKLALVAKSDNRIGNDFWSRLGWDLRNDLNYYTYSLNDENK